jgi:hypothetical protein
MIASVRLLRQAVLLACLVVAGCNRQPAVGPQTVDGMLPVGTVDMHQFQAAYIGSAGGGDGTLYFHGRSYPFTVAGVGIGGIGASTIEAKGDVYALHDVDQFAGAYAQGRYGVVVGDASAGDLWLKNANGVVMHLKAKRQGLMLSLGGDAVVITLK